MADIKVSELLWSASSMLMDTDPQFTVHGEREMVEWLNDAQMAVTKFLPLACSRVDVVRLKPGTKQSIELLAAADVKVGGGAVSPQPVEGVELLEIVRNMGADGMTPGRAVPPPVSRSVLDRQTPNWHQSVGDAVRQVTFDPRFPEHFYVQPGVPAGRTWLEIGYIAKPLRIPDGNAPGAEKYMRNSADPTLISVDSQYREDLVNYICARAYLRRADSDADSVQAEKFVSLFTASINATVTALMGVNPNLKRLPFAPQPAGAAS